MYKLDNLPGRVAFVQNKEYLFCSGYAYLGMAHLPAFSDLVKQGLDEYGPLFPSARISNTRLDLYEQFEDILSDITATETSATFSSGFMAGQAVMNLFKDRKILRLPNTHPAIDGNGKNGMETASLLQTINEGVEHDVVIAADSVNPLTASINDFSFLHKIDKNKSVTCIIDDSHGMGLIGEKGEGIRAYLPRLENVTYIFTYSLSKAFNIVGGAVSGDKSVIDQLRRSPFYTASTPIPPCFVFAFINGKVYYQQQLNSLRQNIGCLIKKIDDQAGIAQHPLLPIFVLPEHMDDAYFEKHQVIISSFAYPDPSGKKINRIVLNALHTQEDLERIAAIIK